VICINISDNKFVAVGNLNAKNLLAADAKTLKVPSATTRQVKPMQQYVAVAQQTYHLDADHSAAFWRMHLGRAGGEQKQCGIDRHGHADPEPRGCAAAGAGVGGCGRGVKRRLRFSDNRTCKPPPARQRNYPSRKASCGRDAACGSPNDAFDRSVQTAF
jgi:hypothetical protein